jgi:DNA-directed RNA polymerase subunit RPC12/RpoP
MDIAVYECSNCGGNLEYKPGESSLVCPYCGTRNELTAPEPPEFQEELDYRSAIANLTDASTSVSIRSATCSGCGAEVTFAENATTGECPYCGTHVVATAAAHSVLQPQYILPFRVPRDEARSRFRSWITSRRFAPNALRRYARVSEPLKGIYYPFWTFDARTRTRYTGQRGEFYTERIRTRDANGNTVTRTVTKTRWYPASGVVSRSFDDVLIPASESLDTELVRRFGDFPLHQMVEYDEQYLSGFHAESYSVQLEDGFASAKQDMDDVIRADVRHDIGGDVQRIASLHTQYSDVTFKYVVLPLYALKYKYREKHFPVVINGVTGQVTGRRPVSWLKIAALVVIIGAVVTGGYFALRYFGVI